MLGHAPLEFLSDILGESIEIKPWIHPREVAAVAGGSYSGVTVPVGPHREIRPHDRGSVGRATR